MLKSVVGGRHNPVARILTFLLVIVMLTTSIVPSGLNIVNADENDTTSTFKFAADADSEDILKSYTYTKEEDSTDGEGVLNLSFDDEDGVTPFDLDALFKAYKDELGKEPISWYIKDDEDTVIEKDKISDQKILLGEDLEFIPIFEEKTEEKSEEDPQSPQDPKKEESKPQIGPRALHTVSFEVEGKIEKTVTVNTGGKVPADAAAFTPDVPDNAAVFNGWYTAPTGGTKIDFAQLTITSDVTVYAQFRKEYLVKWIDNSKGKDEVVHSELVDPGGFMPSFTTPESKISKTTTDVNGLTINFKGWNYKNVFTGDSRPYDASDNFFLHVNSDIDFYTNYSNKWTVIFVSEGTPVDSQLVDNNGRIDTSANKTRTTREGYDFSGWATKNASGNFVPFNTNNSVTDDMVLYAQWTPKQVDYKVVYWFEKPNKFANEMTQAQKDDKSNYRYFTSYDGQATAGSNINVTMGSNKTPVVNGTQLAQLTTLRPNTSGIPYKPVRVGDYTGISTNNSEGKILGTGGTVINVYFERTMFDMQFKLNPPAGGRTTLQFNNSGTVYNQYSNADNLYSFKAKYEQDISDLWPSYENASIDRYNSNGSRNSSQFTHWTSEYDVAGWVTPRYTLNNELLPHFDDQKKLLTGLTTTNLVTKKVNYYVECLPGNVPSDAKAYTVNGVTRYFYLPAGNTQTYGQDVYGGLGAKSISGFTNVEINNDNGYFYVSGNRLVPYSPQSGHSSDREINFVYTRNNYTLKFSNAGGLTLNATAAANSLGYNAADRGYKDKIPYEMPLNQYVNGAVTASKTGYSFEGWYYDADHRIPFEATDTQPADEVELFAKMTSTDHKIRYFGSTAHNTDADALKIMTTGNNSYLTAADSPAGYSKGDLVPGIGVFSGWKYRDPGTNQLIPFSYEMPITRDLDLYAAYDLSNFKLTYERGEGSGTAPVDNYNYRFGEKGRLATKGAMIAPAGKHLIGWQKKNADGTLASTIYRAKSLYPVEGDTTMVALWGDDTDYPGSITFHRNQKSTDTAIEGPYLYKYGWTKLFDVGFTNGTYKQLGWSTNRTDRVPEFSMTDDFNVTGHHDLYAIWEFSGYDVKFIADTYGTLSDGTNLKVFPGIPENSKWEDVITVPGVRPGNDYYFAGWELTSGTVNGSFTKDGVPVNGTIIESDLTFKAKFERKGSLTIKAGSDSKVYDGTPLTNKTGTATGLHAGDTLKTVTMTALSTITDVGTQDNVISEYLIVDSSGDSANHKYYNATLEKGKLEVTKKKVTVTAESETFIYDEKPHSNSNYTVTGLLPGHEIKSGITIDGTITYPGTVTNKAIATNVVIGDAGGNNTLAKNYEIVTVDGTLTVKIGNEKINIRIVGNTSSAVYNAHEQVVTGYAVYSSSGALTNDYTFEGLTKAEAKGTDSAKYDMNLAKTANFKVIKGGHDVTAAYTVIITDGYLDITKRPVWVKAGSFDFPLSDAGKSNIYHVMDSYQAQGANVGLITGQTISAITFSPNSVIRQPNESPVGNTITAITIMDGTNNATANYNVNYIDGELKMTKTGEWVAEIIGKSDDKVYNATSQSIDGFTSNIGNYFNDFRVIVPTGSDIATGKNVDTYYQTLEQNKNQIKIEAKLTGSSVYVDVTNYFKDIKVTNGALKITKFPLEYKAKSQTIPAGGSFVVPEYDEPTFPAAATTAEKNEVYARSGLAESGHLRMLVDGGALSTYATLDTSKEATYDLTWDKVGAEPQNYSVSGLDGTLKVYNKPVKEIIEGEPTTGQALKVGDKLTYRIAYTNSYTEDSKIVITDKLDKGLTYISSSPAGVYDNATHTLTWTFDNVKPGEGGTVELTVEVNKNALVEIGNTAVVKVGDHAPDESNTVKTKVDPVAPKKEVTSGAGISGAAVNVGDDMQYGITYKNYDLSPASITITDRLPSGVDFVRATNGGTYDSATHTVTWNFSNVPSGTESTVYVDVKVNKSAAAKIENDAVVKVGNHDPKTSNKVVNKVNPSEPGKEIIDGAPASGSALTIGSILTYNIMYSNYDQNDAKIVITDKLDKGLTYVSSSPAGVYDSATHTVTWTFNDVKSGTVGNVQLTVEVNKNALVEIGNTAEVKVGDHNPDSSNTVKTPVTPEKPVKEVVTGAGVGGAPVKIGDEMTYQITYRNFDTKTANINITDRLPDGVDFVSATNGGNYTSGNHTVSWNIPNVASGDGGTVTIVVKVNKSALVKIENDAIIKVGDHDPVTSNKVENPIEPDKPGKTVKNTSGTAISPDGVKIGDRLTYTIEYKNYHNSPAAITITDELPEGVDFVSASNGGSYASGPHSVTWTFNNVAPGAEGKVTIDVIVNAKALVEIENDASVKVGDDNPLVSEKVITKIKPDDPEKIVENASGTSIDGGMVKVGDELKYTIKYANFDNKTANITITDELPLGVDYISSTGGGNYNRRNHTVTWTLNNVPAGEKGEVTIDVQVNNNAITKIENEAIVKVGDNNPLTSNKVENYIDEDQPLKTVTNFAGVDIEGDTLQVGDMLIYKISYRNPTDKTETVTVTDKLPKGVSFFYADPTASYDSTTNTLTWTMNNVKSGEVRDILVIAQVEKGAPYRIANTASVKIGNNAPVDSNEVENFVEPEKPVKTVKNTSGTAISDDGVRIGDKLTYTITYSNFTDKAADITITDQLPLEVDYVASSGNSSYNNANRTVTWTLNNVAAGDSGTVTVDVIVNDKALVEFENDATVKVGDHAPLTSEKVITKVDPSEPVKKVADDQGNDIDGDAVNINDELTYTIEYANYTKNAADITITDKLPSGVDFVSATNGGNYNDVTHTVTWNLTNVPSGDKGTVSIEVKVNITAVTKIENEATVTVGSDKPMTSNKVENTIEDSRPVKTVTNLGGTDIDGEKVAAGQFLVYKITYKNFSSRTENVVVTDTLPKGVELFYTDPTAAYDNTSRTLTWTMNGIRSGEVKELLIMVRVEDSAPYRIANTASVKIGNNTPVDSNEVVNFVEPNKPEKTVKNTSGTAIGPNGVKVGDKLTYTIGYENFDLNDADIVITDKLPKGVTYIGSSNGGTYDSGSHTVTWTMNDVASGVKGTVTVDVEVNKEALVEIENDATVVVGNHDPLTSNTVKTKVEPEKPVKEVTSDIGKNNSSVRAGQNMVYTISFKNYDNKAADVEITDQLPAGVDYVDSSNGGTYNSLTHTVTWKLSNLKAGEESSVTVEVKVNRQGFVPIENEAYVKVGDHNPLVSNKTYNPLRQA